MICERCHGAGMVATTQPCPDCGGCGRTHCCEGDRVVRTYDEFVCAGCGHVIYSVPPRDPPPELCGACAILEESVTDPVEREELRKRLRR